MQPNEYIEELNKHLTYLISFACSVNELDLVGATFAEFRGAQDAGWTTAITAHEVFAELQTLGARGEPLSKPEVRQVLCLYAQLSEAGGVYESLLNILRVIELKPYSMWPFQDMVRVRERPHRIIGPNANAMFRRLAETALSVGMIRLAELLEMTFRDDIRNGMFHADYVLAHDGLRLRRRNGGYAEVISYEEMTDALQIALGFFQVLRNHIASIQGAYNPPQEIVGRFSAERGPMRYTIESTTDGAVSISTRSAGFDSDEQYERQQYLNNRLGGKVFAAYAVRETADTFTQLLEDISRLGFDIQLIVFETVQPLQDLLSEIDTQGLWCPNERSRSINALLLATPHGFVWIESAADFQEVLPICEPIEFE